MSQKDMSISFPAGLFKDVCQIIEAFPSRVRIFLAWCVFFMLCAFKELNLLQRYIILLIFAKHFTILF